MSTDILLDTTTHDIDFSKGGTLISTNREALGQRLKVALLLRTKEWKENINKGVPYHTQFFRSKDNKAYIDSFYQKYILEVEGVNRLVSYSSEIDNTRKLNIQFTVKTTAGTIEHFLEV